MSVVNIFGQPVELHNVDYATDAASIAWSCDYCRWTSYGHLSQRSASRDHRDFAATMPAPSDVPEQP